MAINEGNEVVQLTTPVNYGAPSAGDGPNKNVVYVNQYGQSVAAPTAQPQVVQQTTVVQPQPQVQSRPNPYYDNMDPSERNARSCAVIFAIISLIAIAVGIIIDELADGELYADNLLWIVYGEWNCGFTGVNAEWLGFEVASWPYSELCDTGAGDGIPIDAACDAKTGGTAALVCVIFSGVFIMAGIVYVQPRCEVKRQIPQCPRILFGLATILCALAPIIWTSTGEDLCASDQYWDLKAGNTIWALTAGCILTFITVIMAR